MNNINICRFVRKCREIFYGLLYIVLILPVIDVLQCFTDVPNRNGTEAWKTWAFHLSIGENS